MSPTNDVQIALDLHQILTAAEMLTGNLRLALERRAQGSDARRVGIALLGELTGCEAMTERAIRRWERRSVRGER